MLEIRDNKFMLDGKPFHIYSGAIHYFRVPKEYWRDRLIKLKCAGFNTVETYVAWNMHEPREGKFDFEGGKDLCEFLKTAQELGLYAIVRPGPYICAEWDFGGFPSWLLKYDGLKLRCFDKRYISFVDRYFGVLIPKIAQLQITNGGPVIAVQIENEYGSYGRDKEYLKHIRSLLRENGINVMLFTSDGESRFHLSGGSLPEEFKVVNFGCRPSQAFVDLPVFQPDKPLMCGELWCGWFDHFREKHHSSSAEDGKASMEKILNEFFERDASFNFYMFHGGTNFGFNAGANYSNVYQPTVTSYDYDSPLSENGDYTSKYYAIRELLTKKQGITPPELPERPKTQNIGEVVFSECASVKDNFKKISTLHTDHFARYMEHYGQSHGMILYHTEFEGDYPDTEITAVGVHDIAYIYINGELQGRFDRSVPLSRRAAKYLKEAPEDFSVPIKAFKGKISIDILVDALGRVNFGEHIYDPKGLNAVKIGGQFIYGFDIYSLPLDKLKPLSFKKELSACPAYFRAKFNAKPGVDCFVNTESFTRGYVFVNGKNLGRYWNVGPQKALYLPGVWLKEENEIIIFESEGYTSPKVKITGKPKLG